MLFAVFVHPCRHPATNGTCVFSALPEGVDGFRTAPKPAWHGTIPAHPVFPPCCSRFSRIRAGVQTPMEHAFFAFSPKVWTVFAARHRALLSATVEALSPLWTPPCDRLPSSQRENRFALSVTATATATATATWTHKTESAWVWIYGAGRGWMPSTLLL